MDDVITPIVILLMVAMCVLVDHDNDIYPQHNVVVGDRLYD